MGSLTPPITFFSRSFFAAGFCNDWNNSPKIQSEEMKSQDFRIVNEMVNNAWENTMRTHKINTVHSEAWIHHPHPYTEHRHTHIHTHCRWQ